MDWSPVGFSEIEKFPSQVLEHHYPDVPKLGDMTKYKEWDIGTVDPLVGGTPCQSFSVAGLRKGMDDPRGNLALVYCGILDHFRPKWFVWENVPGVLSSNGGRDFGSFLGALAQLGYGFAYRVLDAQFFGVAQRRRRVFVVGYLGDWRPAATVLFERKSLRRDTAPSREKGQVTPTLTKEGTGVSRPGHNEDGWYVAATLTKAGAGGQNFECGETYIPTTVGTLCADTHSGAYSGQDAYTGRIISEQAVRRLTPVECERLQGFPDNYTDIKENCPDGPRYKALGNSMAVPVMRWIGGRINGQD
jgi:DNA (cytosine-5)-methyltransferase 1